MLNRPEIKSLALIVAVALPLYGLAWMLSSVLVPLLLSASLYVLLDPLVTAMERRGASRRLAIGIVLLALLGAGIWIAVAVAPFLGAQFATFQATLPDTWQNLTRLLDAAGTALSQKFSFDLESDSLLKKAEELLQGFSNDAISQVSGLIADVAMWLFLVPFITFFLLRDFRILRNRLIDAVPNRAFELFLKTYHQVGSQLENYLRGVMLQSTIMAVIVTIGFGIVGLPMAALLGIMAGIFNLIPYIGPLLAFIPPLLVALSTGIDPHLLAGIVAVLLIAQLNDNLVVVPAILARAANLHPLAALLGIVVAGNLFGLPGMVMALPTLAAARIVYLGLLSGLRHAAATST